MADRKVLRCFPAQMLLVLNYCNWLRETRLRRGAGIDSYISWVRWLPYYHPYRLLERVIWLDSNAS